MSSRWSDHDSVPRGADYDRRWAELAAAGKSIHGEADLISRFEPASVLDAGCGTGRVAIELAARGIEVVGVDLDPPMLAEARTKAPQLEWVEADLLDVSLDRQFDVVAMAGNVMIFVRPGSEQAIVANLTRHIRSGGLLIAGFQLDHDYTLNRYDADCAASALTLEARFSTWACEPFKHGDYAVSVHRAPS